MNHLTMLAIYTSTCWPMPYIYIYIKNSWSVRYAVVSNVDTVRSQDHCLICLVNFICVPSSYISSTCFHSWSLYKFFILSFLLHLFYSFSLYSPVFWIHRRILLTYMLSFQVWDLQTLQCTQTLNGHARDVTSVICWDSYLLSASLDNTLKVWLFTAWISS